VLWESSKVEQRYDAVLGVIRDGFTVTEVAKKFGVSRQSVHTWIQCYEAGRRAPTKVRRCFDKRSSFRPLRLRARPHLNGGSIRVVHNKPTPLFQQTR
jgi:transposase-like protein